ncbi:MAG: hypothetical protein C0504_11605 [Candidatus Solibacter sp.]|nr:hypothetical protein [Candidatus Solibacter sp.]
MLIAAICAAALWAIVLQAVKPERFLTGANDFAQLYAGARLVGTPGLYSVEANERVHLETLGYVIPSVYYSRLPFYAWMLRPLAGLPYQAAYWTFQALSAACLAWFLWMFVRDRLDVAIFAFLYPPLVFTPFNGQDVSMVLALAAAGYLLMERERPFTAGLVWALCAIKPHLVLLLPVALIVHRKWRALAGGVAGGGVLIALCYLAQGGNWMAEYGALLGSPELHPNPQLMPNFQAVGAALPALDAGWLVAMASVLVAAVAAAAFRKSEHWAEAFALSLPASLLISVHAYAQDTLLLLLPLVVLSRMAARPAMVRFAALMTMPLTPVLVVVGAPWSAVYPALLAAWVTAGALRRRSAKTGADPCTI